LWQLSLNMSEAAGGPERVVVGRCRCKLLTVAIWRLHSPNRFANVMEILHPFDTLWIITGIALFVVCARCCRICDGLGLTRTVNM
jgi:hypothetical protein